MTIAKRLRAAAGPKVRIVGVCELTYYCAFRDIHMKTVGYRVIADLVAKTLPRRGA